MVNNSLITTAGKSILLYRGYTGTGAMSITQYLPPMQFSVGISNSTPTVATQRLDYAVPFTGEIVNETGTGIMTGTGSESEYSTLNTTTYKEGCNLSDNSAINLISTGTGTTTRKAYFKTLASGTGMYYNLPYSMWFYVKDATTLAKFTGTGTCLKIGFGNNPTNCYVDNKLRTQLSSGWNYLTGTGAIYYLTGSGTPTGTLNNLVIDITTGTATATFAAGDVIVDIVRQWSTSTLTKAFTVGYPSINLSTNEVEMRGSLLVTDAQGFLINSILLLNNDSTPLGTDVDVFTGESKSSTDEFTIVVKNRIL